MGKNNSVELVTTDIEDERIIVFNVSFEWLKNKVMDLGNNFNFIEFYQEDDSDELTCRFCDNFYYSETRLFYEMAIKENALINSKIV
jgi:hypothetical protein